MDMSLKTLETYRWRYARAGREWKSRLLDEACAMEGWSRKHAIKVLRRKVRRQAQPPRGRKKTYGQEVAGMLEKLWLLMDRPCGKLMAPGLPRWLDSYERRHGAVPAGLRGQRLEISPAQIDRLLAPAKLRHPRKRKAGGGSVHLRNQIPVRAGPWAPETPPGFLEMDTVSHGGDSTRGTYLWTLTATDISSGWTLLAPAWGCGQHSVLEAFRAMRAPAVPPAGDRHRQRPRVHQPPSAGPRPRAVRTDRVHPLPRPQEERQRPRRTEKRHPRPGTGRLRTLRPSRPGRTPAALLRGL